MKNIVEPIYFLSAFNCPHCNAFAEQTWYSMGKGTYSENSARTYYEDVEGSDVAICRCCNRYSIWSNTVMVYPIVTNIEPPNDDLRNDIKEDYLEATRIVSQSPRGAVALLRLCIQKICEQLGESGKNINNDIASLVKKGLDERIKKALDIVRVIGNESVHPGQLHLKDDIETASRLFELINLIADTMITKPRELDELYNKLPENKRKEIESLSRILCKLGYAKVWCRT